MRLRLPSSLRQSGTTGRARVPRGVGEGGRDDVAGAGTLCADGVQAAHGVGATADRGGVDGGWC